VLGFIVATIKGLRIFRFRRVSPPPWTPWAILADAQRLDRLALRYLDRAIAGKQQWQA